MLIKKKKHIYDRCPVDTSLSLGQIELNERTIFSTKYSHIFNIYMTGLKNV